jgi:hypothetical protein
MSNRCYLSCSNSNEIYPSFSDPQFDADKSWIVHGVGCLPLIWLPLFTESDLTAKEFSVDGKTFTETAPIIERHIALERLESRRNFLNEIFFDNGGLNFHIDIFKKHLESFDGRFITAEVQEIGWLFQDGVFLNTLRQCFSCLDNKSPVAKEKLIELSTVMPERKFLTKSDFEKVGYDTPMEDKWNYFRILGEAYLVPVPWE